MSYLIHVSSRKRHITGDGKEWKGSSNGESDRIVIYSTRTLRRTGLWWKASWLPRTSWEKVSYPLNIEFFCHKQLGTFWGIWPERLPTVGESRRTEMSAGTLWIVFCLFTDIWLPFVSVFGAWDDDNCERSVGGDEQSNSDLFGFQAAMPRLLPQIVYLVIDIAGVFKITRTKKRFQAMCPVSTICPQYYFAAILSNPRFSIYYKLSSKSRPPGRRLGYCLEVHWEGFTFGVGVGRNLRFWGIIFQFTYMIRQQTKEVRTRSSPIKWTDIASAHESLITLWQKWR